MKDQRYVLGNAADIDTLNNGSEFLVNPGPSVCFDENNELILIGTDDSEKRFFKMYSDGTHDR